MAVDHFDSRTTSGIARPGTAGDRMSWLEAIWAPRVLSIVRIVTGLIFMEHGTQKWLGFPPSGRATPELFDVRLRRHA
jgi:hypothetical protein